MKNTLIAIFLSLIWTSFFVAAAEEPCAPTGLPHNIPRGYGTGNVYLNMTDSEKNAYAMGALNGMLAAPFFGAPEKCTQWLYDYIKDMSSEQVAAIITKSLKDNPERWHKPLTALSYAAIRQTYNKEYSPPER
jgi:hypothetical protein